MASPYDLPHIDLSRRLQATPFTSAASNQVGAGTPRSREEHGEKLRGELAASYRAFDAARREDPRLDSPQGAFLEVELKRGSRVEVVERKKTGIQPGAARLGSNENWIVGLYVADESREIFADILREYQHGELTPGANRSARTSSNPSSPSVRLVLRRSGRTIHRDFRRRAGKCGGKSGVCVRSRTSLSS